ncbi:hypothetical protein [Dokdonella sp.]|uniref:hypothetical protein n=1 Tax=Dokdonella sp. TaxID=2291710 RepID=UPI0031C8C907|nr:hypothetical protein [Dokdonella sp.]
MLQFIPPIYASDAIEQAVPDVASARRALGDTAGTIDALCALQRERFAALAADPAGAALLERTLAALLLCHVRLALRHGSLGEDFHAYHNEGHVAEICDARIGRLLTAPGAEALTLRDWCALLLFGGGHDLQQRRSEAAWSGIGANECASALETLRILDACGFSRSQDADLYLALELMIAGSTFDARPLPGAQHLNAADLVQSGGALAARLDQRLDASAPAWRHCAGAVHGLQLALLAADLDTANVAEPFADFAASGERLCREREMLAGRALDSPASAAPVLGFLTHGQHRFFFELHAFHSLLGRAAFEAAKRANAPCLKALTLGVRARVALAGEPASGAAVLAAYRASVASVAADCAAAA